MDDTEDDAGYPPHPHHHRSNASSHLYKLSGRNFAAQALPPPRRRYLRGEEDDEAEEDEEVEGSEAEEDAEQNELGHSAEDDVEEDEQEQDDEDEENEEEEEDEDDGEEDDRHVVAERPPLKRRRKRRRLDRLALGFEFAPRVAAAASTPSAPSASRHISRNSTADWSEDSTFVLLDTWGDLYLQNGRKSIRSDEWAEVAKKVSQSSRTSRSEAQCRNRLDTLKKKYKKEKTRMSESSDPGSDWIYFTKMDSLMSSPPPASAPQQPRLPCGFDSGEYVFMSSKVYVNRSNDLDEMRDTPADSECEDDNEDDEESEGLPPERAKPKKQSSSSSFRMLAESIQKFGEIYEKIEDSKRQHMAELERMRKEFHEDLELQKRQILERAQAEIAKIRQGSDGEDDDDEGDDQEEDDEDMNNEEEDIDVSLEEGSG